MNLEQSFYNLTPDQVLDCIQDAGFMPTGKYIQLNSYENRVFDIFLEPSEATEHLNHRIVTKFYRPNRWSRSALEEEHEFLFDLKENHIPAIAPLVLKNDSTLWNHNDLWMTIFPKGMGRLPQEFTQDQFRKVGRMLAQLHNVGQMKTANHRPLFDAETYGWKNLDILDDWVAPEVYDRYMDAAESIVEYIEDTFEDRPFQRIHGDCHKGNILLWDKKDQPNSFFFVDFDDFVMGPVEQDFWMLLPGYAEDCQQELNWLLDGYGEIRTPPKLDLPLYSALRGLRVINYGAWIAKRYGDPTFPQLFPQFTDYIYWVEECEILEKIAWSLQS